MAHTRPGFLEVSYDISHAIGGVVMIGFRLPITVFVLVLAARSVTTSTSLALAEDPLTNADVVELYKVALGDDLIIQKIASSQCDFTLDIDALKQLKTAGISDSLSWMRSQRLIEPRLPPKA